MIAWHGIKRQIIWLTLNWTISYGLCWNIDSRKRIWRPRAHFGSENESLNGLNMHRLTTLVLSRHKTTVKAIHFWMS